MDNSTRNFEFGNKLLIVQDRLTAPGGGERVVYHIADNFDCDILTGEFRPDSTYDFDESRITELNGNTFRDFVKSRVTIDWSGYDAVIFSGNRPQFCLWSPIEVPTIRYCHSPTRTFWSLRDSAYREAPWHDKIMRHSVAPLYRTLDRKLSSRHDLILTNSHNIRSQVDRFYGLDADVLHPPIDTGRYSYKDDDGYWLSVNRLVPKKRIREQIHAFKNTDQELRIVGGIDEQFSEYGEEMRLLADQTPNVQIMGFLPDEELANQYSRCKGVIYIPYFEDFGIVPLEAMASGKPVVAAAEGGPIETVQHGQTGWLIKPSTRNIRDVVTSSFDSEEYREKAQSHVESFNVSKFCIDLQAHISSLVR